MLSIRVHLSPGSGCGLLAYASARRYYKFPHICGQRYARASGRGLSARLRVDLRSTPALPLQEVSTHQNHS